LSLLSPRRSRPPPFPYTTLFRSLYALQPAQPDSPGMATLKAIQAFPGRVWQAVLARVTPRDQVASAALTGAEASSADAELAMADWQRQQAVGRLLRALKVEPGKGIDQTDN